MGPRDHLPHLHPREHPQAFPGGIPYDAHPMGILVSAVAALSTFYPEAQHIFDTDNRYKQIIRLIAKMPTLAAAAHRFSVGMPFVYPDTPSPSRPLLVDDVEDRGASFEADPVLSRRSTSCSSCTRITSRTAPRRRCGSLGQSHVDPYSACAAACAALYGPRQGSNGRGRPDARRDRFARERP